ncbi:Unknown protein [Striga hermonthica]|uniref:ATP-dependent DNA helicase n=1 Tax=Striga hermonthica TaxID=68872 RepID=A0A9N7MPI7_STRHE|nr:Unknown protein [Striga hermonthica]
MFASLLISGSLSRPDDVWQQCWILLSDDILYRQRQLFNNDDLRLGEDAIKNLTLAEIETLMRIRGSSLREYSCMPYPNSESMHNTSNRLILDELNYDRKALAMEHETLLGRMTGEQKGVYSRIMFAVDSGAGGVFFVCGYGGTGKTYLWRTLSAALRSKGKIVLNVASSGIASLLLPGGRTAHSRFRIPISIHENSSCDINQASPLAELIMRCSLIIWDEASMMHKHCFEAVQTSLQGVMGVVDPSNKSKPFGGKPIVFGGDF